MIIAGIQDIALYNTAREILLIMGEYFQIQVKPSLITWV